MPVTSQYRLAATRAALPLPQAKRRWPQTVSSSTIRSSRSSQGWAGDDEAALGPPQHFLYFRPLPRLEPGATGIRGTLLFQQGALAVGGIRSHDNGMQQRRASTWFSGVAAL